MIYQVPLAGHRPTYYLDSGVARSDGSNSPDLVCVHMYTLKTLINMGQPPSLHLAAFDTESVQCWYQLETFQPSSAGAPDLTRVQTRH